MVDSVNSASQSAAAASDPVNQGIASLASNFNTFLSLLTTQLQNQDPLSPLDSNQFTQQLVQMTGVEQQLAGNDLLKQLVSNTGTGISTAVSLIGKDVRAVSSDANLNGGQAQWTYNLGDGVTDLKVEVVDSNGTIVHTESPTDRGSGDHAFTWNGTDLAGNKLPDGGTYTLKINATDATGASVATTTYISGVVSGVEQDDGQTYLTINGNKVTADTVTSVTLPPPPTTTT
jgi:flagellar basal-body rod modification protein FlgD